MTIRATFCISSTGIDCERALTKRLAKREFTLTAAPMDHGGKGVFLSS
jgi:hypothetical protein